MHGCLTEEILNEYMKAAPLMAQLRPQNTPRDSCNITLSRKTAWCIGEVITLTTDIVKWSTEKSQGDNKNKLGHDTTENVGLSIHTNRWQIQIA